MLRCPAVEQPGRLQRGVTESVLAFDNGTAFRMLTRSEVDWNGFRRRADIWSQSGRQGRQARRLSYFGLRDVRTFSGDATSHYKICLCVLRAFAVNPVFLCALLLLRALPAGYWCAWGAGFALGLVGVSGPAGSIRKMVSPGFMRSSLSRARISV